MRSKDNPADLINVALEELFRAPCELPGYTTLDAMAAAVRAEVNTGFFQAVTGRLDAAARARLARLLVVAPVSRRNEFDWLKDVAKAASLGTSKERLALLGVANTRMVTPRTGVARLGRPFLHPDARIDSHEAPSVLTDNMMRISTDRRMRTLI